MTKISTKEMIEWLDNMIEDNSHSFDDATLENEMQSAIHAFLVKHSDPNMVLVPREEGWFLPRKQLGYPEAFDKFLQHSHNAHMIDIKIRADGVETWYQGDCLKYMVKIQAAKGNKMSDIENLALLPKERDQALTTIAAMQLPARNGMWADWWIKWLRRSVALDALYTSSTPPPPTKSCGRLRRMRLTYGGKHAAVIYMDFPRQSSKL